MQCGRRCAHSTRPQRRVHWGLLCAMVVRYAFIHTTLQLTLQMGFACVCVCVLASAISRFNQLVLQSTRFLPAAYRLRCQVQQYAWGKIGADSAVAQVMSPFCGQLRSQMTRECQEFNDECQHLPNCSPRLVGRSCLAHHSHSPATPLLVRGLG